MVRSRERSGGFEFDRSMFLKIVFVAFLAVYLIVLYRQDSARDVSIETLQSAVGATSASSLQLCGSNDLRQVYQIDADAAEGFVFYKAASPMAVEEFLVLKARDKASAQSLLAAVQAHLDSQEAVFGAYGTDQMGLLKQAAVGSKGNYVYYICGAEVGAWRDALFSVIG